MKRWDSILWASLVVSLAATMFLLYRHYVLAFADSPSAFRWLTHGIRYRLLEPRALGVFMVLPLLLLVLGYSLADLPWSQRALSVLFRVAFLGSLGLGLAQVVRSEETQNVCTVLLVDVSDSVPDEALEDARASILAYANAKGAHDLLKLVTFAERPRLVEIYHQEVLAIPGTLRHIGPNGRKLTAGSDIRAALAFLCTHRGPWRYPSPTPAEYPQLFPA